MYNQTIFDLIPGSLEAQEQMYRYLRQEWPQISEKTKVRLTNSIQVDIARARGLPIQAYRPIVETWKAWWAGLYWPYADLDDPYIRWRYSSLLARSIKRIPKLFYNWITGRMRNDDPPVAMPAPEVETLRMKSFQVTEYRPLHLHNGGEYHRLTCVYAPLEDVLCVYDPHNGAGRLPVQKREQVESNFIDPIDYMNMRHATTKLDPINPDAEAALRKALERYKKS